MLNKFYVDEIVVCIDDSVESGLLEFEKVYRVKRCTNIFGEYAIELDGFEPNVYAVFQEFRFENATLWKFQCDYFENYLSELGIYIEQE